uniref:Uncharacterized protein n=1 Tax=Neobodo designis TaxID=312471 RepID=A0A7S1MSV7_NEODS|mmetsp:Transcript_4659/g.14786  ORF Transcript_4659/g.14786 Transcript_4659/m.14786 type:complete len:252 (+) Transcript_4659:59-814(+)
MSSDAKQQQQPATTTVRKGWAPLEERRRRFHEKRLKEVLPAQVKTRDQLAAVIQRKHGTGDERRARAEEARRHWVRQGNVNDLVVNAARRAVRHGNDAAAAEALLHTRGELTHRGPRPGVPAGPRPLEMFQRLSSSPTPWDETARSIAHTARSPDHHRSQPPQQLYGRHDPETGELEVPEEYEVHTARYLGHAPLPPVVPGEQDWQLNTDGQTPRTVAAAYASDRERRAGETFVLPALHVPKVRLTTHRRP